MLKKTIINVETGEVIEEELTAEERVQYEADQAEARAKVNTQAEAAAAKAALLAKLGITEEEAKLLLG